MYSNHVDKFSDFCYEYYLIKGDVDEYSLVDNLIRIADFLDMDNVRNNWYK